MRDIIITLPSSIEWSDYEKELDAVADWKQVMNFKVPFLPKQDIGRCYVVHKGKLMGWMQCVGAVSKGSFTCSTTGQPWDGNFIQRSGPFHYLDNPIQFKGFQGWRYYDGDKPIA